MAKFINIGLASIFLFVIGGNCFSQERNIAPYFGVSGSLDPGIIDPIVSVGWGTEVGVRISSFYVGAEYGIYSYRFPTSLTTDPTPGSIPPPSPISSEKFWGIHAGCVLNKVYYLGIVVINSHEVWHKSDSAYDDIIYTNHYLNIGPDFRYAGMANGHMYLALALTVRRILKVGLGYIF